MANLIIRPASGAGNKVVVQDQAGAAVLTTADSGAAIASGVTGGAGLDALSASNLSAGTVPDARFPAGVVVNNWKLAFNVTSSNLYSISTTFAAITYTAGTMTISGITATEGNLLYITAHAGNLYVNSDGTYQTDVGFLIDGAEYSCSGSYHYITHAFINGPGILGMIYTVPASFTGKVISAAAQKEGSPSGSTFRMQAQGAYVNTTLWMLIQEIKQ
jgi:hypothetical protein